MTASIEATGVGTQLADPLVAHEGRSAARRLITGLFDAWDAGDTAAFLAHFTPDAEWSDPSGERSTGRVELGEHFARWRTWEPFSVHWVSNEQVLDDVDGLHATWLWSAASNIDHGTTAAWSGGDLDVRVVRTDEGWRVGSLVITDRYRTPYRAGWLDHLLVQPALDPHAGGATDGRSAADQSTTDVVGVPLAGIDVLAPPAADAGTEADRLDALDAESEVRWILGEYADAVEQGDLDADTLAAFWRADGTYSSEVVTSPATGLAELVRAHESEAARASAWIRALMSLSILVDGAHAQCRWRDIWTAEVDGQARWLAHAYTAAVVRTADGWRIAALQRHPLLDCSYQEGWTRDVAGEAGRVAKETRR